MADTKKYISLENLTKYDELIKDYVVNLSDVYDVAGSAATAELNAKNYAGVIPNNEDNQPVANTVVDYVNLKTADIATSGELSVLSGKVTTLIGSDENKSVRTIANEELAAQLLGENAADDNFKTLQELATWLENHPEDVAAINLAIQNLQTKTVLGTYVEGSEAKEYGTVKAYVEAVMSAEVTRADGAYVAKETDKGLSTNDLTDTLKTNYDAAYAHSQVAHAPANAQANIIESVKVNGTALTITGKAVDISVPTDNASLTNGAGYLVASDIADKADNATTLAGYGITDAYTSMQVDALIAEFVECDEEDITGLFNTEA